MRRGVGTVIALIALAGILVGGVWLGNRLTDVFDAMGLGRGDHTEAGPTVVRSIQQLNELTAVEIVEFTTIEKGNDQGILNFARGDKISLLAVARVGAGVDLAEVGEDDAEIDFDARSITLRLPAPKITYVALDNDATQVYDRDTGIFTKGDPQLESEARRAAEDLLGEKALEAGILDEARSSTTTGLREFLRSLGFEQINIEIEQPR